MEKVSAVEADILTLPHANQDPSRANIFRGRRIVIRGRMSLPGQSVALYAGEVVFEEGGLIDTSGAAPGRDYTGQPATAAGAPGSNGNNGEDGADGMPAGHIRIWTERIMGVISLRAVGGDGGRGQDGAGGVAGQDGAPASRILDLRGRNPGGAGGNGGNGGNAGKSGNGGAGGDIDLAVTSPEALAALRQVPGHSIVSVGGHGGGAALAGAGAVGGSGGAGGPYGSNHCRMVGGRGERDVMCDERQDGVGPPGRVGMAGSSGSPGAAGSNGRNGQLTWRVQPFGDLALYMTARHLSSLLALGEGYYLTSDYKQAAEVLAFVQRFASQRARS